MQKRNDVWAAIGLVLLLVVAGCSTKALAPEAQQRIRTVAVISAIGDEVVLQNVPLFIWDQAEYRHPFAKFGLDEHVTSEVSRLLATRYEVRTVTYDRSAFVDTNEYRVDDVLRSQTPTTEVDAFVVVLKGGAGVGNTRNIASGLGAVRFTGFTDRRDIHAVYRIAVIENGSFKLLGRADAMDPSASFYDGHLTEAPHQEAESSLALPEEAALTPAQEQRMAVILRSLIDATLARTLQRLNLLEMAKPQS